MPDRSRDTVRLPADVKECHAVIEELVGDVIRLEQQLEWMKRRMFGRSSERIDPADLTFFGQEQLTETEEPAEEPETDETKEPEAKPSRRNGRKALPKDLPRTRIEHEVPPEERCCPDCGEQRARIGEDVSEQLEYVPSSMYVIEHAVAKYACRRCQGNVVQGEKPAQPIEKGLAGPGLLAHIIVSKYMDHLPLHRMERILARHGVDVSRKTMCDWMMTCAMLLRPIVRAMRLEILKSYVIPTDDTTVPVQDKGKTRNGRVWVYLGDAEYPYVVFDYTPTRARAGPEKWLEGYEGFLQADAYSGYDKLFQDGAIVEVGCWAHARRYFFESKRTAHVLANRSLVRIKALYAIEREAKDNALTHEDRRALRKEKAAPLLEDFFKWLEEVQPTVLPKSPMGKAIGYALNHRVALSRYVEDGRLEIDNNASERELRNVVIGRKNWLFAGSDRGGEAAAVLYSLVASARRHGIDPFVYLRDLLERVPTHPQSRISDLFPDNWKRPAETTAQD